MSKKPQYFLEDDEDYLDSDEEAAIAALETTHAEAQWAAHHPPESQTIASQIGLSGLTNPSAERSPPIKTTKRKAPPSTSVSNVARAITTLSPPSSSKKYKGPSKNETKLEKSIRLDDNRYLKKMKTSHGTEIKDDKYISHRQHGNLKVGSDRLHIFIPNKPKSGWRDIFDSNDIIDHPRTSLDDYKRIKNGENAEEHLLVALREAESDEHRWLEDVRYSRFQRFIWNGKEHKARRSQVDPNDPSQTQLVETVEHLTGRDPSIDFFDFETNSYIEAKMAPIPASFKHKNNVYNAKCLATSKSQKRIPSKQSGKQKFFLYYDDTKKVGSFIYPQIIKVEPGELPIVNHGDGKWHDSVEDAKEFVEKYKHEE